MRGSCDPGGASDTLATGAVPTLPSEYVVPVFVLRAHVYPPCVCFSCGTLRVSVPYHTLFYFIFLSFCFRFVLRCRWRCVNVRRNFSYPTDDLPDWHSCILLIGQCEEHTHIQRTMQESTSPTQSSRRKTSLGAHSPLHTPSFLLLCLHVVRWIRRAHPHQGVRHQTGRAQIGNTIQ